MVYRPTKLMVLGSACGVSLGLLVFFKEYVGGKQYEGKETLEGKTVVITGANCGVGKETARLLAKRGGRIILACRDLTRCEEARKEIVLETKNSQVICKKCDLSSLNSVRAFTDWFNKEESRLDILINNAGVMRCPRTVTAEGFEMQLGVNHLGHFVLTNLLLNKLISSAPSRIINVSSVAHHRGQINFNDLNSESAYDPAKAYNQSKLANVLFTKELSKRLADTGVTTYAVHPGIVNTNIIRHMGIATSFFASFLAKPIMWIFTKTPRQGAQTTTVYCALEKTLEKESGLYYSDCAVSSAAAQAEDDAAATRLWAISERWTTGK
ncbi:hypothetical protein CHUAL_009354 [Chamberlinius hualienensis]